MGLFSGLLIGDRLYLLILLFLIFSGLSLFFFSAGQPRALLKGLWMTLVDLFAAPFAYLRYGVFRLATESGQSVRLKVTDPQFLLRASIRIQLAVLFLSLSAIGSIGLMMVLDQSVPPEVSESRNQAALRLQQLQSESVPAARREIEDLQSKLDGRGRIEEELRKKRNEVKELTARIESSEVSMGEADSGGYFANVNRFLEANRGLLRTPGGRDEIRNAVARYLRQSPTQAGFDDMVFKHLDLVFQRAVLEQEINEIESANRPQILQKAKAEAEGRLRELEREIETLEKESSIARLIASVSLGRIQVGILLLLAVVWAVLWIGGVAIESAEIFIDIATNLRRIRRVSEGRPDGTLIVPTEPDPSTSA